MKKVLISMMVCILISSCNLFKNTTKEKFQLMQGYELDSSKYSKNVLKDLSKSGVKISILNNNRNLSSKTIKADKIKINADGSLEAEGNVEYSGSDEKERSNLTEEEKFNNSNIHYAEEAASKIKKKEKIKIKDSSSKNDVSLKGILIIVFCIITLFFFIFRYLKNKFD